MSLTAYLSGLGIGASLIIAIGAQNAFVLRQGLLRSHALSVAAVCVAVDWVLIVLGALGMGALVERFPAIVPVTSLGGAAFLLVYGGLTFRSALHPGSLHAQEPGRGRGTATLKATIATTLAVSLLNPHVYLDTVVLLGGIASTYAPVARTAFVLGSCTASATWFFGLAAGARLLEPLFEREVAWRVLDVVIGCVMWWIAATLAWGTLA